MADKERQGGQRSKRAHSGEQIKRLELSTMLSYSTTSSTPFIPFSSWLSKINNFLLQ